MLGKSETYGRSVKLKTSTYDKAEQYRAITGVPIARIVQTALEDWLDTVGAAQIEAMIEQSTSDTKKVIAINEFDTPAPVPNNVVMINSLN